MKLNNSYVVVYLFLFNCASFSSLVIHIKCFSLDGDETLGISGDSMDAGDKDGEPLREQVFCKIKKKILLREFYYFLDVKLYIISIIK